MITDANLDRYSRQLLVPGFELEGQEALAEASVLLLGCGGLGVPVAMYLAAAGVGHIRLVDPDGIEWSNLPRQIAYTENDVGKSKADVLAQRLSAMADELRVDVHRVAFDLDTGPALLEGITIAVDASDNRAARCALDQLSAAQNMPWVMGAAVQASGQNLAFSGARDEGCYHCLAPEATVGSGQCAELGILGPVVGAVALTQALDVLRYLTGFAPVPWGILRLRDFRTEEQQQLMLQPSPTCPLCQSRHDQ